MKIGILGGTFDPIHIGHTTMAEQARDELGLDKVLFIPSNSPWKDSMTDARVRVEMVRIAIQELPKCELSLIDMQSNVKTFTIDTIRALKLLYFNAELYFICGADSFCNILEYKNGDEIVRLVNFIVIERDNADVYEFAEMLNREYGTQTTILEGQNKEVSSTRVRQGHDWHVLSPKVAEYIKKMGLWKNE